jgi:ferredoxin
MKYTMQVAPEDCTGCEICVEVCPAKNKTTGVKALYMAPQRRCGTRSARTTRSSSRCRRWTGRRPSTTRSRAASSSSRSSSTRGPARGAARRRTSSWRRSSSATGWWWPTPPAARRSSAATCRRPRGPATRDGQGPAWANSLFEDNAEFGFGMRLTIDKHQDTPAACCASSRPIAGEDLAADILTPCRRTSATSSTSGARRAAEEAAATWLEASAREPAARRCRACCGCSTWPTTWSRSRCGSSAATAGRTTSATAASTTCWRRTRTSTCWCSTPRSTRTPAARRRRRRRAARWPLRRGRQADSARRTWGCWP